MVEVVKMAEVVEESDLPYTKSVHSFGRQVAESELGGN